MGKLITIIPALIIDLIIFLIGFYSGMKTYAFLREYFDLMFRLQKTEKQKDIENYELDIAKLIQQLIPWALVYILCIVLFVIISYVLLS